MNTSKIEWTDTTWNPTTGCDKVSAGCKNCYAETLAMEMKKKGIPSYRNGFGVTLQRHRLKEPREILEPKLIFVNSMSDLFHSEIPISYIQEVFKEMNEQPWHVFQVLTKRPEILLKYDQQGLLNLTPNIWVGASVEDEKVVHRIDDLRSTAAKVKFLSCEPLIGPLYDLNLEGIDWLIVGGESGKNFRPVKEDWIWDIKQQCEAASVPFFFKQWAGINKYVVGKTLKGKTYLEMPKDYYARQKKWNDYLDSKKKVVTG